MARATRHYGEAPIARRGWSLPARLALAAVIIAALSLAIGQTWRRREVIAQDTAIAHASAIVGPACPTISAAAYQQSLAGGEQATEFDEAVIGRHHGDAFCSQVSAHDALGLAAYSVCQFNDPWVLKVRTKAGTAYFNPGAGRKATLEFKAAGPSCVMAVPYWSKVEAGHY